MGAPAARSRLESRRNARPRRRAAARPRTRSRVKTGLPWHRAIPDGGSVGTGYGSDDEGAPRGLRTASPLGHPRVAGAGSGTVLRTMLGPAAVTPTTDRQQAPRETAVC